MVNARLTVDPTGTKERYAGIIDCIQKVYRCQWPVLAGLSRAGCRRNEGITAFFAGLGGAFGTVVASAIQLSCYEQASAAPQRPLIPMLQCKKTLNSSYPAVLKSAVGGV